MKRKRSTSYKQTLSPIKNRVSKARLSPCKSRPKKTSSPSECAVNSISALKVSKKDAVVLKQALEELWSKGEFPESHKTAFKRIIEKLNIYKAVVMMVNEMESIERNTHLFQQLKYTVTTRNTLLKKLYNATEKSEMINLLAQLRVETCEVINKLKAWRAKIEDNSLVFEYEGENYVITVRDEYFRLVESEVGKWFMLEKEKADVLLLSPKVIEVNSTYFKYYPVSNNTESGKLRVPLNKDQLHKFVSAQKYFENELKILALNGSNKLLFNSKLENAAN
eukprot:TRINITY_DN5358_c0_g3_i2.p1 TRINITY_DN5358_c0_g3~~TRINITY_DN5358_c0_g3_i2.p1  ORF type:complete len:279 (+),score=63.53 TRINITY_DN5358_c0_g3_i2:678-1514(+)